MGPGFRSDSSWRDIPSLKIRVHMNLILSRLCREERDSRRRGLFCHGSGVWPVPTRVRSLVGSVRRLVGSVRRLVGSDGGRVFGDAAMVGCCSLAVLMAGCKPSSTRSPEADGGESGSVAPNLELQGKIEIDGSSTVYPISEAVSSAFSKRFPNVNVVVGASGSGSGFDRFSRGQIDISDASRPIEADEFAQARENGVEFLELPVAYDGLTMVVHKENEFVDQLTIEEIAKIFRADVGAKRWSEVREGWPDERIQIFAPGTDSGTFDYFMEVVAGEDGTLRSDMSTSEDDNVLVTGVSGSPYAIGFFGLAYFEMNREKLTAVPVVNPETGEAVLPNRETVEKGTYAPFSRPLFIYVNNESIGRPEVKRFVNFYLDVAAEMALETGYVPLPESIYDAARARARARQVGTHYLTSDLESRRGPVTEVYVESNLTGTK